MIVLSGGVIVNTVFTSNGTRSQMLSQLETALITAGWTPISGAGTSDWIYETATTPQGQKIRVEGIDLGGATNCIQLKLRSGSPNNLNPTLAQSWFIQGVNTATYRIWANKYSFFFFKSGVDMTAQRAFVMAGVPYLWDFMVPILNGSPWCGYMHGNAPADASATQLTATFRNTLGGNSLSVGFTCIWNENIQAITNGPFYCPSQGQSSTASTFDWQYEDGSYAMFEPLLCWATGVGTAAPHTRHGQIYDAVCTSKQYVSEDIRTIGGLRWMSLTHLASATMGRVGMFLYAP